MNRLLKILGVMCAATIWSHAAQSEMAAKGQDMSGLTRSINVIETILDDMKQSYSGAGGGGIASVRQRATSTYEVTVLEEERKVIVRYRLSFDADGGISIAERSETAESQP